CAYALTLDFLSTFIPYVFCFVVFSSFCLFFGFKRLRAVGFVLSCWLGFFPFLSCFRVGFSLPFLFRVFLLCLWRWLTFCSFLPVALLCSFLSTLLFFHFFVFLWFFFFYFGRF